MHQDIEILNEKFGIDGRVRFDTGAGGLARAHITATGGMGELYLHGAHVTAWEPTDARPVLWMSDRAVFADGQPIRGGVPICFPWFGPKADDPDAPAHGLVRTRAWEVAATSAEDSRVTVALRTSIDGWDATYTATFGSSLTLTLAITNTADAEQGFEAALHTYLAVSDAREVSITGLAGATYLDKMDGSRRKTEGDAPIRFTAETDRVYLDTDATCALNDPGLGRRIIVGKTGSRSTVVWNPWVDKSARMPDFGDDEWPGMCCIETAAVAGNAISLAPGQTHEISAALSVEQA